MCLNYVLQNTTSQKCFEQPAERSINQFIKQQRAKGHLQVASYNTYKIMHQKKISLQYSKR